MFIAKLWFTRGYPKSLRKKTLKSWDLWYVWWFLDVHRRKSSVSLVCDVPFSDDSTNFQRMVIAIKNSKKGTDYHHGFPSSTSHRIHGAGIYANIWGILMGSMLPYIAYMDPMGFLHTCSVFLRLRFEHTARCGTCACACATAWSRSPHGVSHRVLSQTGHVWTSQHFLVES
jgi:hypothetical protein